MNTNGKTLFKLAISSQSDRLSIADFNALDDLKKGLERRGFDLVVVTHADAPNLEDVERWAKVNEILCRVMEEQPPASQVARVRKEGPDRLLAIMADGCVIIGAGDNLGKECRAAGVPIWTFTPHSTDP